jgi:hypothetical protein
VVVGAFSHSHITHRYTVHDTRYTICVGIEFLLLLVVMSSQACPELTRASRCILNPCPIDCQLSVWAAWGACSQSCDGGWGYDGTQQQHREVVVAPTHGGKACSHRRQVRVCGSAPCAEDCTLSPWGGWSTCLQATWEHRSTKGACDGESYRSRQVQHKGAFGGKACPPSSNLRDRRRCSTNPATEAAGCER